MRTPLQKEEQVLLVTYSSWVTLIVPSLVMLVGLIVSYLVGFTNHWGWVIAVAVIIYFVIKYFTWKANIWVVTSLRVIDEAGLINHFAKESPLEKINNVSYDQNIWGRIFNYGHVEIQTAAQVGATDYFNVHHPKRLKDTITQAQSDLDHIKIVNQAKQMTIAMGLNKNSQGESKSNIASDLEQLYELRKKGILTEEEYNRAKNKLLS